MAPADLLRGIARRAGCHLFSDSDDIIYANRSFLAIHTGTAGKRTFHLRRKADVVDVFSGKTAGEGITGFNETIDIIHTEGVRFGAPSSAPQARKAFGLQLDTRSPRRCPRPAPCF